MNRKTSPFIEGIGNMTWPVSPGDKGGNGGKNHELLMEQFGERNIQDFMSSIFLITGTRRIPSSWKRSVGWLNYQSQAMFQSIQHLYKFWVFRGYSVHTSSDPVVPLVPEAPLAPGRVSPSQWNPTLHSCPLMTPSMGIRLLSISLAWRNLLRSHEVLYFRPVLFFPS